MTTTSITFVNTQSLRKSEDPWLAAKLGRVDRLRSILKRNPHLLNEKDQHMNTPLYYASLCGHMDAVHFLSNMGARDNSFGICYLNALNLQVRRLLKSFNVYKHLSGSKKIIRCPSIQDCLSEVFERYVMRDQEAIQATAVNDEEAANDDDDDDEEEAYYNESEEHGYSDVTLILKHDNTIIKEFPCHLFVLLAQGGPGMAETLLLGNVGKDVFQSVNQKHKLIRQRVFELKQRGEFIIEEKLDPCALEVFLRFLYTGRLIFPWRYQRRFQEEDAELRRKGRKIWNSIFPHELLFGNTLPDKLRQYERLRCFMTEIQPVFDSRNMPLIQEVIRIAQFFRMDDMAKYIEKQMNDRKQLMSNFKQPTHEPNRVSKQVKPRNSMVQKPREKKPREKINVEVEQAKQKNGVSFLRDRNLHNLQNIAFKVVNGKTNLEISFEEARERIRKWYFERVPAVCVGPCKEMLVALRECCDIGITMSEHERDTSRLAIYGPKALLAWRSDFFRLLLSGGFSEAQTLLEDEQSINREMDFNWPRKVPVVEIYDCSTQSLWSTLQYCFSDIVEVRIESAVDVLMLGNRFGPWKKLQDHCISLIRENINADTVYDMFLIADMFSEQDLRQDCFNLIKRLLHQRLKSSDRNVQEMHAEFEEELLEKGFDESVIEDILVKL